MLLETNLNIAIKSNLKNIAESPFFQWNGTFWLLEHFKILQRIINFSISVLLTKNTRKDLLRILTDPYHCIQFNIFTLSWKRMFFLKTCKCLRNAKENYLFQLLNRVTVPEVLVFWVCRWFWNSVKMLILHVQFYSSEVITGKWSRLPCFLSFYRFLSILRK